MAKAIMSWVSELISTYLRPDTTTSTMSYPANGGLALARNKPGLSSVGDPIIELDLPSQLIIPLLNYAKQGVDAVVNVGDDVHVGSVLAKGIIASANGTVSAIEPRPVIHPSYREVMSVVIDVDTSQDQNTLAFSPSNYLDVERLERACVSGLGGAGYGTANKLRAIQQQGQAVDTLLVNAVECEPLISCDEALIRSDAASVVDAIRSMITLSACRRCIVAIEDDKTEAIAALREKLDIDDKRSAADTQPGSGIGNRKNITSTGHPAIEIIELPAVYPSGSEKVLMQRITGKPVPSGMYASDIGVLCLNVATIVAARQAQAGHPLVTRIVTVGGSRAANATNVRVRIGTPVAHVLKHTDNQLPDSTARIRAGGPLSGFDLADNNVPVTATTNCIGIEGEVADGPGVACIRCSQCSDVCPVNLIPQQLHWYAANSEIDSARKFGLDDCIECGCCDLVCPSSIKLTSTFRYARSVSREQSHQNLQARLARNRFEKRKIRLERREREAQSVREHKRAQLSSTQDSIAAALARARQRRKKT